MNSITTRYNGIKPLTVLAGVTLLAGLFTLLATSSPAIALLAKLAVSTSIVVLVAMAIASLMRDAFAAHVLRNEDFHWY